MITNVQFHSSDDEDERVENAVHTSNGVENALQKDEIVNQNSAEIISLSSDDEVDNEGVENDETQSNTDEPNYNNQESPASTPFNPPNYYDSPDSQPSFDGPQDKDEESPTSAENTDEDEITANSPGTPPGSGAGTPLGIPPGSDGLESLVHDHLHVLKHLHEIATRLPCHNT